MFLARGGEYFPRGVGVHDRNAEPNNKVGPSGERISSHAAGDARPREIQDLLLSVTVERQPSAGARACRAEPFPMDEELP